MKCIKHILLFQHRNNEFPRHEKYNMFSKYSNVTTATNQECDSLMLNKIKVMM